jgi:heme-degrading monooxygenase HmoA
MTYAALAIHHPRPEHRDEWIQVMLGTSLRAAAGAPGLIEMTSYADTRSGRLVGMSRWESLEALDAVLPTAMAGAAEYDKRWGERPTDVLVLQELA